MTTPLRRARVARFPLLLPVLHALWLSLATPAAAYAHGALRRAVPASNARLSVAPRELRLTFTERVELSVARVTLAGPGGAAVALAPPATVPDSAHIVVTAIRGVLAPGAYTVTWQVAGRDGHPVRGRYTFTLLPAALSPGADRPGAAGAASGPPSLTGDTAGRSGTPTPAAGAAPASEAGAAVTAPGQAPPPAAHHPTATVPAAGDVEESLTGAFDAESPAYVAVRWLTYLALLAILGAVTFRGVVLGLPHRAPGAAPLGEGFALDAARRAATLGLWGAGALLLAALARLGAQSVAMHGTTEALDPALVGAMLRHTVWGWGWLLQVGGAALAASGFAAARRQGRHGPAGDAPGGAWATATAAALVLAFTPALSGHAAAASRVTPLAILSDGLHVLGAGGWLGSLLVVLAAGVPAAVALGAERRGAAVAALVRAFSPTALTCAGVVAATGALATWVHVGRVGALWETGYGRVLLLKLGVLSLVVATGAYNWRRVVPALGGDAGTARLRRSAAAELAVGMLVLLATAALVATPTPAVEATAAEATGAPTPAGAEARAEHTAAHHADLR